MSNDIKAAIVAGGLFLVAGVSGYAYYKHVTPNSDVSVGMSDADMLNEMNYEPTFEERNDLIRKGLWGGYTKKRTSKTNRNTKKRKTKHKHKFKI